jgi:hypothetical protein
MAQQLPKIVQSASGKSYDSSSPQGKMIVNSPNYKNPFDKQSSALAPMDPSGSGLAETGNVSPMSPIEGAMAVFQSMADSLESIKESAISLVMSSEGDARGDALAAANVEGDPDYVPPVDPEAGGDDESKPSRIPSLKKIGLTLLIAGVMLFAEKIKPVLAKVLEGFKFIYTLLKDSFVAVFDFLMDLWADPVGTLKKSLDAVLDGLASLGAWIWDKGIKPVWDWITGLFDSGAGAVVKEKFLAVAGVFTSFGQWIWDKAIKPVWDWISGIFKSKEDEDGGFIKQLFDTYVGVYTGMGQWIWDKAIKPVWDWISGIFKREDDKGGSMIKKIFMTAVGVYTGMGQWVWDNAIKPIWDWISGIFKRADDASGGAISGIFTKIVGPFVSFGKWIWDNTIKPIWDWITGIFSRDDDKEGGALSSAWTAVVTGFTSFGKWIWDKTIKPIWDWISGIFSSEDDEEGGMIKKLFTAYVGAYAKVGTWIWDKAIKPIWDWISGIFSFSGDETEKDPNYKPFSIIGLVTDAIKGIGKFLKDMFTFDPSKITEGLMDFGGFMKAISFASTAYLKTLLNPFQKGSNAEAAKLAYESKFDEIMGGGSSGADITPTGNGKTEELKTVTDQFTRGQEKGTTFIQDFSQQSDVKQQNGDVVIGKDLGADDPDPTLLMMFQNLQRAVF